MKSALKWLQFMRPQVQRDLVALVHGCHEHPAYRAIRRSPKRHGPGVIGTDPDITVVFPGLPPCPLCTELYAAKRRVKGLLG